MLRATRPDPRADGTTLSTRDLQTARVALIVPGQKQPLFVPRLDHGLVLPQHGEETAVDAIRAAADWTLTKGQLNITRGYLRMLKDRFRNRRTS
jgi:hypothetical protein